MVDKLELLNRELETFEDTGEGWGFDLRLDLAELIVEAIRSGISQREIARRAGMHPAVVNRIIHGESNVQFDSAGRILHAIGVRAAIIKVEPSPVARIYSIRDTTIAEATQHGQNTKEENLSDEESIEFIKDSTNDFAAWVPIGDTRAVHQIR